jgi:hypothetical protein
MISDAGQMMSNMQNMMGGGGMPDMNDPAMRDMAQNMMQDPNMAGLAAQMQGMGGGMGGAPPGGGGSGGSDAAPNVD